MPFIVLFTFLTAPFVVGVAVTLAAPQLNTRANAPLVYVLAVVWCVLAHRLKAHLQARNPDRWVRRWLLFTVALPLLTEFGISLTFDREFVALWARFQEANAAAARPEEAQAAPGRHSFTPAQLKELFAAVQPRASRYLVQLFQSLPGKWWLFAFLIAAMKGK